MSFDQNRRALERIEHGAVDVLDWGALGFTIHTLYGVFENYMLKIPDIRPALLDDKSTFVKNIRALADAI